MARKVVLKTLDKYIEDRPEHSGLAASLGALYGRDPRFAHLLALSIVGHLILFAIVLRLDIEAMKMRPGGAREVELVTVAELAPPSDRSILRSFPESIERADLDRLKMDPDRADDTHLIARSPKPTARRGTGNELPPARAIEEALKVAREAAGPAPATPTRSRSLPPVPQPVQIARAPQPDAITLLERTPGQQSAATAPAPAQRQNATAGSGDAQAPAQAGSRRSDSTELKALGLQEIEAQYLAYVRAKISRANERNMPRDWIKDVLTRKVSADFELALARGGEILFARLVRSSGYSVLDDSARQAIYLARPFDRWPQNAGDRLTFTVTVYYTPVW